MHDLRDVHLSLKKKRFFPSGGIDRLDVDERGVLGRDERVVEGGVADVHTRIVAHGKTERVRPGVDRQR
ncbi:MAG: hypothetical protein R6V60_19920, partial [Desulfobacterales bacterium]